LLAAKLSLGIDEVYYWKYSQFLKWTYFDHPPMVGWAIYLSTLGDLLHTPFFVRLPALISWVVVLYLVHRFYFQGERAKYSLLWLGAWSLTIYGSIIAGTMVLPDGPLLLFSALFFVSVFMVDEDSKNWLWWILLALGLGLSHWSKYQSFLWPLVFFPWVIWKRSEWLKLLPFWAATALYVILASGLVYTNLFSSTDQLGYHGSRFDLDSIRPFGWLTALLGEAVFIHPLVFIMVILGVWKINWDDKEVLLLLCGLPILMAGWGLSMFERILPHWTGPGYLPILLVALPRLEWTKWIKPLKWAVVIQMILLTLVMSEVEYGLFSNMQAKKDGIYRKGRIDGTLDIYGWDQLAKKLKASYDIDTLVVNHWYPGSHYEFYLAPVTGAKILPYGEADMLHEYVYHPLANIPIPPGSHYIESSRFPRQAMGKLDEAYDIIEVGQIPITRRSDTVMYYFVHEVYPCKEY
jgi:4-amino-4-deoxy-L-arabinose transferase-like glycosyltransferase